MAVWRLCPWQARVPDDATETVPMSPWHEPLPEEWSAVDSAIEVQPPRQPQLPRRSQHWRRVQPTRQQTKDALHVVNTGAARDLARRTGPSHAQVNAELNRQVGLRRITEATVGQLETRLEHADRWLARTV
jgi:hypothetical protein